MTIELICKDCNNKFLAKRITKKRCPLCHKKAHALCSQKYFQNNKETIMKKHTPKIMEWYYKYKDKINKRRKERLKDPYFGDLKRQYWRDRYNTIPLVKIKMNVSSLIYHALQRQLLKKNHHTKELCGCSWDVLMEHIESQFKEGMSWENHGEWHIDHIRPCVSFNLCDPQELFKCFHYTNLQPLWKKDNLMKSSYYKGKYYAMTPNSRPPTTGLIEFL